MRLIKYIRTYLPKKVAKLKKKLEPTLYQYNTGCPFARWVKLRFLNTPSFSMMVAYSDKMLFLDLGPGTSDLGSLI